MMITIKPIPPPTEPPTIFAVVWACSSSALHCVTVSKVNEGNGFWQHADIHDVYVKVRYA